MLSGCSFLEYNELCSHFDGGGGHINKIRKTRSCLVLAPFWNIMSPVHILMGGGVRHISKIRKTEIHS